MALLDKRSTFARELSIPGVAGGPTKFGEALPLSVMQDWGVGDPLFLEISCPVAAAGGTSVAFSLVTADDDALNTNAFTVLTTPIFQLAALTAGARLFLGQIPSANYRAFMGLRATTVGTFTAGKINAFIPMMPEQYRAYAGAVSLI